MAVRSSYSEVFSPTRRRLWIWILLGILILLALLKFSGAPPFGRNVYQAVFLDNGQVYFGKLRRFGDYPVLKDVYYLQITQQLQGSANDASNVNLVKLGNELHGPTDQMRINRQSILFIEDLKPDSQVVQAIERMKTGR